MVAKNKVIKIRANTWKVAKEDKDKEYQLSDDTLKGYYIRLLPSGVRSYNIRTKVRGKLKHQLIGDCRLISEADARKKALEYKQSLKEGKDTLALEIAEHNEITLLQLLDRYKLLRGEKLRDSTYKGYKYNLGFFASSLSYKPAKDITAKELEDWYIKGKKHKVSTERTFVTIKTLLKFGFTKKLIPEDITPDLAYVGRYQANDSQKHIGLDDISFFMSAFYEVAPRLPEYDEELSTSNIPNKTSITARDYILFLLATGLRKSEATSLQWKDVNFRKKTFDIPYNKVGRFMRVPMTRLIHDMLRWRKNLKHDEIDQLNAHPKWVFPNKGRSGGFADPRKALFRISSLANFDNDIAPHDLRRTFSTYCKELGFQLDDIGKLLNHANRTVTDSYVSRSLNAQRQQYEDVWELIESRIQSDITREGRQYKANGVYNYPRVFWYGQDYDWFTISPDEANKDTYWDYLE